MTVQDQQAFAPDDHYIDALLSGEAIVDVIVDELPVDQIQTIARHPEVSWSVLTRQADRDAAVCLLEHRFQCAFLDGDDTPMTDAPTTDAVADAVTDVVIDALESPEMIRDAASEPMLLHLAMRAITGLAWRDPKLALLAYQRYYATEIPDSSSRPNLGYETDAVYAVCQRVLAVAPAWRRLQDEYRVPTALRRFVCLQWVVSADVLDQLIGNLRRDMTSRPHEYLDVCDRMAAQSESLLRYVSSLTERFLPDSVPSLGELGDDERERLEAAMGEIDAPMSRGVRFSHLFVLILTIGGLLSIAGFDRVALTVIVILGGGAAAYSAWAERGVYGRMVRPHLAEYLADVGTPVGCVVSWLLINGKSVKRVKAFDVAIDADDSLDLLARLGRMARLRDQPMASAR